jgi:hypothetical protein
MLRLPCLRATHATPPTKASFDSPHRLQAVARKAVEKTNSSMVLSLADQSYGAQTPFRLVALAKWAMPLAWPSVVPQTIINLQWSAHDDAVARYEGDVQSLNAPIGKILSHVGNMHALGAGEAGESHTCGPFFARTQP